jgi:hypothetical protein
LFQYLADCGVAVSPTSEKSELIRRILGHWGSPIPNDSDLLVRKKQFIVFAWNTAASHHIQHFHTSAYLFSYKIILYFEILDDVRTFKIS